MYFNYLLIWSGIILIKTGLWHIQACFNILPTTLWVVIFLFGGWELMQNVDIAREQNRAYLPNASLMLAHRLRRWPNIKQALGKYI